MQHDHQSRIFCPSALSTWHAEQHFITTGISSVPPNDDHHPECSDFFIHDPNACWCSGCKRKFEIGSVMLLCLNCPFGFHKSSDGISQNSKNNHNHNSKGYILCNKCGKEFSKHHLKKGHCFVTLINRKFSYEALLESARFDTLSSKISATCISKNGVLVADDFCKKVEACHAKANCWLFTKPKELFAEDEIQIYNDNIIHRRVTCDACECTIHGTRYCCLNCADFDLCSNCMKQHLQKSRRSISNGMDASIHPSKTFMDDQNNCSNTDTTTTFTDTTCSHNPNHVFLQTLLPLLNRPKQLSNCVYLDDPSGHDSSRGVDLISSMTSSSMTWYSASQSMILNNLNFHEQAQSSSRAVNSQQPTTQNLVSNTYNTFMLQSCNTHAGLNSHLIDLTQQHPNVIIIPYNENLFDMLYEIECLSFSKAYNRDLLFHILDLSLHNSLDKPVDYFSWVALMRTPTTNDDSTKSSSQFQMNSQHYVAGFIMYNINKEKERAEISSFAVHPSLRNHGIGRELLRYSLAHILKYEWLWYGQQNEMVHHVIDINDMHDCEDEELRYYTNEPISHSHSRLMWKHSCRWIQLHVSSLNLAAQKLYTKFGFKTHHYHDNYYSHFGGDNKKKRQHSEKELYPSDTGDGVVMILTLEDKDHLFKLQ
ncbi:hypothetical protein FDP41_007597 [Naegleria fowleri]|uniref:N-alpha-acetyltransferase 60 n=1 Tax=Naegleria fowleri TaxID=5763 RepID=A0A6A5C9N6_NAEFO|nr:uncharacterized protein FDP41_007597 [Naegleria fowleri]KAF0983682.1 hypothetical protein FDP41_007597 [Naegleria fowleri]